jgi:hypothetical protein
MDIGIEEVLSRVNNTVDHENSAVKVFGLRFLTAEGEKRELTGRKYTRGSRQELVGKDNRGKDFYHLQRNGVMMIADITNARTIAIKPSMIYGFKDHESDTWLKVFH